MKEEYAASIIDDPSLFDALHIHGVRSVKYGRDEVCEVDDEHPQFYSVYAHLRDGGEECIGDFSSVEDARDYANRIAADYYAPWKVEDYTHGK